MKIVITGNMGYVGPLVLRRLRSLIQAQNLSAEMRATLRTV